MTTNVNPTAGEGIPPADPFLDPEFGNDPYPFLKQLRESDPANLSPLGFWRLTRYADVVRLLKEVPVGVRLSDGSLPGQIENDPRPSEFMLQKDPPDHTRLRRLVSRAFTPRAIEAWRPRVQAIVDELIDRVRDTGGMDVIADLALPVPSTLICEMMGVPVEDRDRFTAWTTDATHALAGPNAPPDIQERAAAAGSSLAAYFQALIEDRRKHLTDESPGLLDALIRAEEEGDRLSPAELLFQSVGLLIAGFETTIGLIGNGVRALIQARGELKKLREDPGLITSAVEECLRYDGPIILTTRVLHEDAEFHGKVLPRNAQVYAMLAGANRDPEQFPDPDRFDIERSPNPHLAFGGGTHFCLGAHLARLEAQIAIGTLVHRLPRLELESETVEWGRSLFRVPERLPVTFARTPAA